MSVREKWAVVLLVLLVAVAVTIARRVEAREGQFGVGFDPGPNGVAWSVRAPGGFPGDMMYMVVSKDGERVGRCKIPLMSWRESRSRGFCPYDEGVALEIGDEVEVDFVVFWGEKVEITNDYRTKVR